MLRIEDVEADCSEVPEEAKLDDGQDVPVLLPKNGPEPKVGEYVDVGCVVELACADGCKSGPYDTPRGPCWHMEFSCRVRCYAIFLEKE